MAKPHGASRLFQHFGDLTPGNETGGGSPPIFGTPIKNRRLLRRRSRPSCETLQRRDPIRSDGRAGFALDRKACFPAIQYEIHLDSIAAAPEVGVVGQGAYISYSRTTPGNYRELPGTTGNYRELPGTTGNYRELPGTATSVAECTDCATSRRKLWKGRRLKSPFPHHLAAKRFGLHHRITADPLQSPKPLGDQGDLQRSTISSRTKSI
jgi:hypothetical protein